MKIVLPKEHGTWLMIILPFTLGAAITEFRWLHIPFFIGWFFIYLSATPWLNQLRNKRLRKKMRPWAFGYSIIGLLFAVPVMIVFPQLFLLSLAIIPFFLINIFFVLRKKERNLLNDISGIAILSLGLPAAYIIGTNALTLTATILWLIVIVHFTGSAFYVKSLIRERRNRRFRQLSHLYHALLLILPWSIGYGTLMWMYVPSALRDFITPRGKVMRPIVIGIIEIFTSTIFFILILLLYPF